MPTAASHSKIDNGQFSMSAQGLATLKYHENVVPSYYNDPAQNCTYGIGTLVHFGSCTAEELQTEVTNEMIMKSLENALVWAQKAVRTRITQTQLNQAQFDALVSFVYNRGEKKSALVLALVDKHDFPAVVSYMNSVVYGAVVDKKTNKKVKKLLHGLVARRLSESAPFKGIKK